MTGFNVAAIFIGSVISGLTVTSITTSGFNLCGECNICSDNSITINNFTRNSLYGITWPLIQAIKVQAIKVAV